MVSVVKDALLLSMAWSAEFVNEMGLFRVIGKSKSDMDFPWPRTSGGWMDRFSAASRSNAELICGM